MNSVNSSGLYLYAIIPTRDHIIFNVPGTKLENDEIFTIPFQNLQDSPPQGQSVRPLAAVVSVSALKDFHGLERPEAAAYLVTHQRVVEAIMRDFPTLPVKFGTVLMDEPKVMQMLSQGESIFQAAFDKYENRVQMEVVVLWNPQDEFQQIALHETIVQTKAEFTSCPAEEKLAKKINLGQQVQVLMEQRRAILSNEIMPTLEEIGFEIAINPLMDDSMVLNVALLLDEPGCLRLDGVLEELDASFEHRGRTGTSALTFRRVGPLPPYSFSTIAVQPISFELIESARKTLHLEETTTLKGIKLAYRQQAVLVHPDLNLHVTDGEISMTKLTDAFRLLTAYAENQPATSSDLLCLDQKSVSQAMLITIQRPEVIQKV